jgi:hypothetical protein
MLKTYFGLRNLNFVAIGRKVEMFSQVYMIHGVSCCGHGEYICLQLANWGFCSDWITRGLRMHPLCVNNLR